MKTYIYIVNKKKNNASGNPQSTIKVYDINNINTDYRYPRLIGKEQKIGYRSADQAAFDILSEAGLVEIKRHSNGVPFQALDYLDECGINVVQAGW